MSVYKPDQGQHYKYDFIVSGHRFAGTTGETERRRAQSFEKEVRSAVTTAIREGQQNFGRRLAFDVAAGRYWDEVGQSCTGSRSLRRELERLVERVGPATLISAIDDAFVAKLVADRRRDFVKDDPARGHVSPAHINRGTTQLLRRILTRAKDVWKLPLPREPRWRSHMLAEPRERVRELRLDEEARVEGVERDDYRAPRLFAQMTGLRRREIAGLRWSQIDFAAETISVTGKGDKPHRLPITPELRALLEPLRGHHPDAVFTYVCQRNRRCGRTRTLYRKGERYPVTYEGLGTQLGRTFAKAGLEGFRIHDLRHTAATRTLRATGNLRVVQALLNHASPAMTARYAHVDMDDLRTAISAAAEDTAQRRKAIEGIAPSTSSMH